MEAKMSLVSDRIGLVIITTLCLPVISIISLGENLGDGVHYWWLDMRQEVASIRRAWKLGLKEGMKK
jgi:hypothetical protein